MRCVELHFENATVATHPLRRVPLSCGRGPECALRTDDRQVSTFHSLVWVEDGQMRIDDLGSRNGTYVNDMAIRGPTTFSETDRVRLGVHTALRITGTAEPAVATALALVGPEGSTPITTDRTHLGGDAMLLRLGQLTALGIDGDQRWIDIDDPFQVDGQTWRIVPIEGDPAVSATTYPYELEIMLRSGSRSEAFLRHQGHQGDLRWTDPDWLHLLFVLARQRRLNQDDGWVADREIVSIVPSYGRAAHSVTRELWQQLRRAVRDAGFDPWFIEERPRNVRLRLDKIKLS